ncbi:histidine-type phosphatase [Photobacterium satsumensis]|uniref:histidine-type phosphatase n=1 Tax=Photobacterium satsumensis TaxID=2910239 RepID=UPI003D0EC45A
MNKKSITAAISLLIPMIAHSETNWESILAEHRPYPFEPVNTLPLIPADYNLVSVNALYRHGSRYALDNNLVPELAITFENSIKKGEVTSEGQLLLENVQAFSDWWVKNSFLLGKLTQEGKEEMAQLGERMLYMTMNSSKNRELDVLSRNSNIERTLQSQSSYLSGMTQEANRQGKQLHVSIINSEDEARKINTHHYSWFYRGVYRPKADNYKKDIIDDIVANPPVSVTKEFSRYVNGLSPSDAGKMTVALQGLCMQDAPQGGRMGMCKPFKEIAANNDIESIEWLTLIKNVSKFYMFGTADVFEGINYEMGKPIIRDYIEVTDKSISTYSGVPSLDVRFGHDSNVSASLVALGIISSEGTDAEKLETWNAWDQIHKSSNVVWQVVEKDNKYKVRMLLNEKPIKFPIDQCRKDYFCDWDIVKSHYLDAFRNNNA